MKLLDLWAPLIPDDVRANLERYGSGALIPDLVILGRQLGKTPFCSDVTASYWAQRILGPSYPLESRDEYDRRWLASCPAPDCATCQEIRADLGVP